jgi:murein L,D-transpeptidase YcbB/YkuD
MRADVAGRFLAAVLGLGLSAAAQAQTAPGASPVAPNPTITIPQPPEVVIDVERQIRRQHDQEKSNPPPQPAAPAVVSEPAERPAPAVNPTMTPTEPAPPSEPAPAETTLTADALKSAAEAFTTADLPHTALAEPALRKEREAVLAFYAARDYAPLWVIDGHYSTAAQSAIARIALADEDGLDLSGYPIPTLSNPSVADCAEAELRLSEAIAAYGRQASGSRLDPSRLSNLIGAKPDIPESGRVLNAVASTPDAGAALQAFNPAHRAYALLREKLQELRRRHKPPTVTPIPPGPLLHVGMRDRRVPLLRARLEPLSPRPDDVTYDVKIASAVAAFQRANGLPVSGLLTARTIAALSGGDSSRLEGEIVANMERWRWLPRKLGDDYIEVNIPTFMLQVVHDGAIVHEARVIVGKPENPTPIFSHNMEFVIVNPYWNVPYSIIKKEMLPKLASDPDYFARHGYEVIQRGDTLIVRQPPGEDNALGRIKFMFPNNYSVYMHDTPTRSLFADDRRAFSHGCVRVDQPFKLAELVLGRDRGWSEDRVKRLIGRGERSINLPRPLPVHIVYFTAFVDEFGKLQVRDDIYGYSQRVRTALGLKG